MTYEKNIAVGIRQALADKETYRAQLAAVTEQRDALFDIVWAAFYEGPEFFTDEEIALLEAVRDEIKGR
jgi:hypothetical protein